MAAQELLITGTLPAFQVSSNVFIPFPPPPLRDGSLWCTQEESSDRLMNSLGMPKYSDGSELQMDSQWADVEEIYGYWIVIPVARLLPPRLEGVQFELQTFPVDAKAVADADGLTVYVDAADPREAPYVPLDVRAAFLRRSEARLSRDYATADALQQLIADAGYRVLKGSYGEDILVKKYRIRLRGIDAPEIQMPYGKEAKVELTELLQGKCLTIGVYCVDHYGRFVGDIHCNGNFAHKIMLQKGFAWHFEKYDKRPELKQWEKEARAARVGLWASPNPQKPWEWRKNNPREHRTEMRDFLGAMKVKEIPRALFSSRNVQVKLAEY
ncbi:uncharacterized 38.1 kDa protein-like [Papaver somniferum]|uniref:uncharacterized 38.1 kDa protein-like n=1 Tax=Papaver somniferum TaxID=3469 RepID=UPI000E70202E|nr:uncharacterized 38.1 kDa protein-like [Papaver somniferum]